MCSCVHESRRCRVLEQAVRVVWAAVQVVTVNDYLARRDSEWVGQVHRFLGLRVGLVQQGLSETERKAAYRADITYVTNSELGFDYLRDNLAQVSPLTGCYAEAVFLLAPHSIILPHCNLEAPSAGDTFAFFRACDPALARSRAYDSQQLHPLHCHVSGLKAGVS